MITTKERIHAALNHRKLDRIAMCDTYYWPETITRWETEGLPKGIDPIDHFGLDRIEFHNPIELNLFPYEIIEETDGYMVDVSPFGSVVKYLKKADSSSGYQELDFKVKTIADWRHRVKHKLIVEEKSFIAPPSWREGSFRVLNLHDHFWFSFRMLGMENLCCWLADGPDEIVELYGDYIEFLLGMLDLCLRRGIEFDGLWFFSDMAYRNGPMFAPATFRRLIAPGYRRLREWCDRHQKPMILHSDGNIERLLPEFIDVGFDCLQPLEARAGNDIRNYLKPYGDKIAFMGNINADIIAAGNKKDIETEAADKITQAKLTGGYIYHIDHSVPPTVSFDAYSWLIDFVKKYGGY